MRWGRRSPWPTPVRCPQCGAKKGVSVVHGLPTAQAAVAADRGEIVLGGCVMGAAPQRQCTACGHRWSTPLEEHTA